MSMTIRHITKEDVPPLVVFLERCFKDGQFAARGIVYDPVSVVKGLAKILCGRGAAWVVEENGDILGFAALTVASTAMNLDQKWAMEETWHPDPDLNIFHKVTVMKMLLGVMEGWAKKQGLALIVLAPSQGERVAVSNMLLRRGYRAMDTMYLKDIERGA